MKKNSTKRSLLASVLALVMCVSMLVGTTFAWFTDTASTGVNKIQAGTLDVALEMKDNDGNWVTAEGKTLQFKVNGQIPAAGTQILWEPGCTYELPELRVVNKGNLALKYKIAITGIHGDAKLNEVIDWTLKLNNDDFNYDIDTEHSLAAGANHPFTIKGHMREDAGNEYQGLSIDNIAITVIATQDTVESDSINNNYDSSAAYCEWPVVVNQAVAKDSSGNITDQTLAKYVAEDIQAQVNIPAAAVDPAAEQITLTVEKAADPANFTVAAGQDSKTYEVKVTGLAAGNATPVKAKLFVGIGLTGVTLTHNGNDPFTPVSGADALTDKTFYYNPADGYLYFATTTFSPFSAAFDAPAGVSGAGTLKETYYTTVADAQAAADSGEEVFAYRDITAEETGKSGIDKGEQFDIPNVGVTFADNTSRGYDTLSAAMAAATDGCTIKLNKDATITSQINSVGASALTIDFNGKTVTASSQWTLSNNGAVTATLKNGTYQQAGNKYGSSSSGRIGAADGSNITFSGMTFKSTDKYCCTAVSIYAGNKTNADITNTYSFNDCTFTNATVVFDGGSGTSNKFDVTFDGCYFDANASANGMNQITMDSYNYGTMNIKNTTMTYSNSPSGAGGYCVCVDTYLGYTNGQKFNLNLENVSMHASGKAMPYSYLFLNYNGTYSDNAVVSETGTNTYTYNGKTVEPTVRAFTETNKSLAWTENAEAYQACYAEWKAYVAAKPADYNSLNYYLVENNGYYFVGGQGYQFNLCTVTMDGDTVTQVKTSISSYKTIGTTDISTELGDADNTSVHIYTLAW